MSYKGFSTEVLILGFAVFVIAASFGSFFKLAVDRYGTSESIVFKPSFCLNCRKNLYWWHNIPILSFLILRGKCFFCKSKIDVNCFYSELSTALVALIVFVNSCNKNLGFFESILFLLFFMVLMLLSVFDLKHRIIPHAITYFSIIAIVAVKSAYNHSFLPTVANLGIAFLFMDLLYFISTLLKRYELEINLLSFPLVVWVIYFCFYKNLYFLFIPIGLYFFVNYFKNLKISLKLIMVLWSLILFLSMFQLYKIVFIDLNLNGLVLFFSGIGIIYFVCEILFYFGHLIFPFKVLSGQDEISCERVTIGGGDITVFASISVFLGYKAAFFVLFIASLLSIISHFTVKVLSKLLKHPVELSSQYIPFVPYLGLACFIIILIN